MLCKQSLHKVAPTEMARLDVDRRFTNIKFLTEGRHAKIYQANHEDFENTILLKCVKQETSKKEKFFQEIHYNFHLSRHPNVVKSYDRAFSTSKFFVFVQEQAPEGVLSFHMKKSGLGELVTKNVIKQIVKSLNFIHSKNLVHRNLCLEHIFVYDRELNCVKLGDFSNIEKVGTLVKKENTRVQWAPPEICELVKNEGYQTRPTEDTWKLGILIFVCLTGSFPWCAADIRDHNYNAWVAWMNRKTNKIPSRFMCFSPRLLRLFRRMLDPKPEQRSDVIEVYKYLSDPWMLLKSNQCDIQFDNEFSNICSKTFKYSEKVIQTKLLDLLL
ncbi:unnamed protein product, partial [Meganyctiphanes norvegica]